MLRKLYNGYHYYSGEDDYKEYEIYMCGPYCTCDKCHLLKGYKTLQLVNKQGTIYKTVDQIVPDRMEGEY